MRARRRISLSTHALVELAVGLALVLASFALPLGGAGLVLTFAAGVLVTGLGLGATDALSLAAHRSLDQGLAVFLAGAAVVAAIYGGELASMVLLAGAVVQLALTGVTRWTRAPLTR